MKERARSKVAALAPRGVNGHQGNHNGFTDHEGRELVVLLMSLARSMFWVDDVVGELPLRQLRVCSVLYEGPRSMSALSRELRVTLSAMTQIADRLERAGLVTRVAEGSDRRVRSLQLTPQGARIMLRRERVRARRGDEVMGRLSRADRKTVLGALHRLLDAARETQV